LETSIWLPFKNKDVVVIGISNERTSTIQQFVSSQGITFPILQDNTGVYNKYRLPGGISPYPRDFIIDQEGIVRYANTEYDAQTMREIVTDLSLTSDVKTENSRFGDIPKTHRLESNYPNPFNGGTTIFFELVSKTDVSLSVYNALGQKVTDLISEVKEAGRYSAIWSGTDANGVFVPSGIYFYQLNAGYFSSVRKMLYVQ